MHVLWLTPSLSRRGGGLFDAVRRLAQGVLETRQHSLRVFGLGDTDAARDRDLWSGVPVVQFDPAGPASFGYTPSLTRSALLEQADLLQVHGLWTYLSIAASTWARARKPYLVSPHGMLDPWALRNSRWKKTLAAAMFENRHLHGAACLHALNLQEADAFRAYGLKNPVCVIPNGVDLPMEMPGNGAPWRSLMPPDARVLLYLGRLHPKKGLQQLLLAWSQVRAEARASGWRLVIAGWDQTGHEAYLRSIAQTQRLADLIHFIGPQFGEAKALTFKSADAFVLPSLSEGLPLAALEAWAHSLPVLMTPHCNLPEGFANHAALPMEPRPDSIASQLLHLFDLSNTDRLAMGQRGRLLVESRYRWPDVAASMIAVYQWVLGRGDKPASVLN